MPNVHWIQLLNTEELMIFLVIHDSKLSIFGTAGQTKQDIWRRHYGLCEIINHQLLNI